ncbi:tape measure protein [Lactiplantibacillus brownii]|uniref:aggregation-promoting factor C-terminal-like domain-containing protein n=1 Tax=Lactiplantibacillus brownii TaxID=3069269 RepID=UPI0038B2ADA0
MADGTIKIDVLLGTEQLMSDRPRINSLLTTLGANAGDQMDQSFEKNASKVKNDAEQAHSKVKSEFGQPVEAKLIAKGEEAGIKNFKSLLGRIPKEKRTELMAKAERSEAINWEETMRKMPRSVITKMKLDKNQASEGLTSLKNQTESTGKGFSHLKEIMAGTFLGGAIQAGVQGVVTGLKDAAKAGMEYNKEQDTMKTVWTALTTEAPKDGKQLVDYINSLSQHSIYAAGTINEMAQSFYHVHSNVEETKRWTDSFVALGSTLHMSNDALAESGEQFAKIVAGGKASAEDMSVMINRFPMFGEALQQATGKSMKQLYAMSASGKMTATQFTEALDYLGKKYKGGTQEAMTSFQGMSMYIKSRWSVLTGEVMASSFKMSKGVAGDMKNLLSDDMMKKYAAVASGAISTVMSWFVKLIGYIDAHKETIVDIIGNLGKIVGIIGKTIWATFSDIIYDIAKMFGLVGSKAKESKDPLDKLDDALKGLAKNQTLVENLTKAFIAMFAIKKGMEFIGMLASLRSSLIQTAAVQKLVDLSGGGSGAAATATQSVGKTAANAAGSAASSGMLGRLFAKGGATSTAELEAASGLGGGKLLAGVSGISKMVPYMSVLASIPELFGTTAGTAGKHVGGFAGSTGGAIAGAAAGSAIMPGVGTIIGGAAGGLIGSKLGRSIGDGLQKGVKESFPKLSNQMSDLGTDLSSKFSSKFKPSINAKEFSKQYTKLSKSLNSEAALKIKADPKSLDLAKQSTDTLYQQMGKAVDKYYRNKQKSSKSDYKTLVKNDVMFQDEADSMLKKGKENDKKKAAAQKANIKQMKKDSDSYYKSMKKTEDQKNADLKKARAADGKNHKAYLSDKKVIEGQYQANASAARKKYIKSLSKDESKMNDSVTKATKISSGKQLDILENLKSRKTKISKQEMTESIKNSVKERDETIKNAGKQRDKVVDSANSKYKKTVAAADKERYENGTMSRKQYNEVVKDARDQRDRTIDAAENQRKSTVEKAQDTHKKVVAEATKQAGEHKGAVDSETGEVKGSWSEFITNMRSSWNGMIGGINGVLHALNKKWGNIPEWKAGSKHAAGLNGSMGEHTALVGEEGFEYMGTNDGSITPIGTDGPEIRNIPAGASILPHGMSVEFGKMAQGLPGYKIGLPGWLTNTFSTLKKGAEGAADLVTQGADGVVNKIADATGISGLAKKFTDNTTAFGAIASGAKDSLIENAIKYVQDFFDQFTANQDDGGGSGSLAPHFGSPFKQSSGYGPRSGGFHKGIDFAAPRGTPIPAQYGGTVVEAGPASGFGNWVVIKPSGASVDTIYGHMKRMKVKKGQKVKAGQTIAWVGSEGQSSGPHVHYELRAGLGGKSYNPMTYGASSGGTKPTGGHMNWLKQAGFSSSEYAAANKIISQESGWNPRAVNPSSGAYGIPQSLPASKMASAGSDWRTNPITQLKWMKSYVDGRYGGTNQALAYRNRVGWYADGGWGNPNHDFDIFNEDKSQPEIVVNPSRSSADGHIIEAAKARAQKSPNGLIAKTMRVVNQAKLGMQRTAPNFATSGGVNMTGQLTSGNAAIGGDMSLTVKLDSAVIAHEIYPKTKLLQQRDITIQAKKGGLS